MARREGQARREAERTALFVASGVGRVDIVVVVGGLLFSRIFLPNATLSGGSGCSTGSWGLRSR